MQPRCYTSLATQNHCYNETWTRLTARSRSLLTSSSLLGCSWFFTVCLLLSLLASSLLGWFLVLRCWSDLPPQFFWSDSVLVCLCLKCSQPWNRFSAYRLGDILSMGIFPLLFKLSRNDSLIYTRTRLASRRLAMVASCRRPIIRRCLAMDFNIPAFRHCLPGVAQQWFSQAVV
jgi:hypothetical protein